jgi:hypothetical protein
LKFHVELQFHLNPTIPIFQKFLPLHFFSVTFFLLYHIDFYKTKNFYNITQFFEKLRDYKKIFSHITHNTQI